MKHKYSQTELEQCAVLDLQNDAARADQQSIAGPFYPERGITAEALQRYATQCRDMLQRYRGGGLHTALVQS